MRNRDFQLFLGFEGPALDDSPWQAPQSPGMVEKVEKMFLTLGSSGFSVEGRSLCALEVTEVTCHAMLTNYIAYNLQLTPHTLKKLILIP